ncbi:MAG: hypothetical protein Q8J78_06285 [Moraxellaceae bacterium]|nr:hypothetical protein [Moraxellaceae bacterium]
MINSAEKSARPGAMSVNDFATWAGLGRTTAWNEIREGRLRAVKVSSRTLVTMTDAEQWLISRPTVVEARSRHVRGAVR